MNTILRKIWFYPTLAVALAWGAVPAALLSGGCEGGVRVPDAAPAVPEERRAAESSVPSIPAGSLSEEMIGTTVRITGEVVAQCPAAGCWLKLGADAGETFVDLLPSPVRLTARRTGEHVQVTGEVVRRGQELAVKAERVEFESDIQDRRKRKQ